MITMIDRRLISRLTAAVMDTFKVLNRIEYQAPWTARAKSARAG